MKKKYLILLMALLTMPVMIFAGGQQPKAQDESAVPRRADGWFAGKDFSKHLEIEFAEGWVDETKDYNKGDPWVQAWTNNFNITWNIIALTPENVNERIRVWVNSGDAPEMYIEYDTSYTTMSNYAQQGLVKKLPDNWRTKYPNLAKAQDYEPLGGMLAERFGGTYYLFRPIYATNLPTKINYGHWTHYVRKDWGQAVGYPAKPAMKLSELIEYARRVKAADPGKIGTNFSPIVLTNSDVNNIINTVNGGSGYRRGADGKYLWTAADQSTLVALRLLNQAYREGLLDKEFYTIKDPDNLGAFYTTGRAAVSAAAGMAWRMVEYENHVKSDLGLNYDDVVQPVIILGEDGYLHGNTGFNNWGAVAFSPDISDEKLDRALQMLDYGSTQEGQYEIRMGIKDVDWTVGADGEIVSKLADKGGMEANYAVTPVYYWTPILPDDFQFVDPATPKKFRDTLREMALLRQSLATEASWPSKPDIDLSFYDSRAMSLATIDYTAEYAALIVKPGDIEANWRAWINEKMAVIQPVLNELNSQGWK